MEPGPVFVYPGRGETVVVMALLLGYLTFTGCQNVIDPESPLKMTAVMDTSRATIGDVLHLQIWVTGAGGKRVQFPDLVAENPLMTVGNRHDLAGETVGDFGVDFEVAFWDTGSFALPPYSVNIITATGESLDYSSASDSLQVTISSVINEPNPQLRGLKPPVPIPPYIPVRVISSMGSILVLMGLLVWLWKKRVPFKAEQGEVTVARKSPYERATEELAALRNRSLHTAEDVRQFYEDLSRLVREFLEFQYFIRSLEMTTEEMEKSILLFPLNEALFTDLVGFLRRADWVKFARFRPDEKGCEADLHLMESFIEDARRDWIIGKTNGLSREKS